MSYTIMDLCERFDDAVAALERIADALEKAARAQPENKGGK